MRHDGLHYSDLNEWLHVERIGATLVTHGRTWTGPHTGRCVASALNRAVAVNFLLSSRVKVWEGDGGGADRRQAARMQ